MTSRERLIAALERRRADRLPVTTHHLMPYFLEKYMNGISKRGFFDHFAMDAILWIVPHKPDEGKGEYYDPEQGEIGFLESRRIATDRWRITSEQIYGEDPDDGTRITRYRYVVPRGSLTMVLQANEYTAWVTECLIKNKRDIEILEAHMTTPKCDVEAVNRGADELGERGIVRGHICPFDVFGQPGTWQDACCLVGTQRLIMETYDDPTWVRELLVILQKRKLGYIRSMKGARFDVNELGGGDASTTVISPRIFNEFVAPYDSELISEAHAVGQRIVYHTCGGMMPILEDIAAMGPDAMETFTPPGMGGDVDLSEAKRRIGERVCMIGGFDQQRYFLRSTAEETREAVRLNFLSAGQDGGYILAPSDHFFDARLELIEAFADEARRCVYL
jgi:uroporphyrinogen decarboxylase